jgi:periplasmic copper chaperone A
MRLLLGVLLIASFPAFGQVQIEAPWIRATAPGAQIAAGYMVIRNKSAQPDRLVGGSSKSAAKVQTHIHIRDGEILRMREVKGGYDVPASGSFELKPGGAHLMLVDIKQPLKAGDKVPVTLRFERAGEVSVEFQVRPLATAPSQHQHH